MKTIKDKQILVGADFGGYPLKEAICEHLRKKGWTITDVGLRADSDPDDTDLMSHRIGFKIGSMIAEGDFERAVRAWVFILRQINVLTFTQVLLKA